MPLLFRSLPFFFLKKHSDASCESQTKAHKGRANCDGKCQLNLLALLYALHHLQLHYQLHLSNLEIEGHTLFAQTP
ncbi:hypothetical protein EUGRSUZ_B02807 [Eucalyptus grandis]|uniref:Uncharacterized protein n=2 Tax=Eucalyptus grandis TaxID=71139 RepID=A0ACC3M1N8_EUCGR|nr:hypothetical protein EUGRSUZ_B02807 [Eucalyptus grandis]